LTIDDSIRTLHNDRNDTFKVVIVAGFSHEELEVFRVWCTLPVFTVTRISLWTPVNTGRVDGP